MTNNQVASLLGITAMIAGGQTLFKHAALKLQAAQSGLGQSGSGLIGLAMVPSFWAALLLYGLGTLWWIWILQTVPLSRAYPFFALAFAVVPLLAALLFAEKLNLTYAVGAALIMAGVIVTARA